MKYNNMNESKYTTKMCSHCASKIVYDMLTLSGDVPVYPCEDCEIGIEIRKNNNEE